MSASVPARAARPDGARDAYIHASAATTRHCTTMARRGRLQQHTPREKAEVPQPRTLWSMSATRLDRTHTSGGDGPLWWAIEDDEGERARQSSKPSTSRTSWGLAGLASSLAAAAAQLLLPRLDARAVLAGLLASQLRAIDGNRLPDEDEPWTEDELDVALALHHHDQQQRQDAGSGAACAGGDAVCSDAVCMLQPCDQQQPHALLDKQQQQQHTMSRAASPAQQGLQRKLSRFCSSCAGGGSAAVLRRAASSRSPGQRLGRASTLQRMESELAWGQLPGLEQQAEPRTPAPATAVPPAGSPAAAAVPPAPPASAPAAAGPAQSLLASVLLRAVLGSGSLVGSLTARLGALLASRLQAPAGSPVYSSTLRKTPHTTLTTDGWTLHLLHVTDAALAAEQRRRYPVLMVPGLASSGPATFDLLPQVSLADFLAAAGWEVWVVDLRGNGRADKASRVDIEREWCIDDYLDVPACIAYVAKATGAPLLHWLGHSMGGMLGSGLCSQGGRAGRRLRSVALLGSGCFGDGSWHCLLKRLLPGATAITTFGFPAHLGTQGLALLANTPAALSMIETLFYIPGNMEPATRTALLSQCFNFIPERLVAQFLASHDSPDGLAAASGAWLYADPDSLASCHVPALGVSGDWDLFCPAAGGAKNVDLFGGPKRHITFGPAHGQQHHYGHFDVIVGKNAPTEVWPHIAAWLEEHDSAVEPEELWR